MSYAEILNPQNRILTQFGRHATLAIGQSSVIVGQTARATLLPGFSCVATDRAYISFRNASVVNANAAPLRSAVITVDGAGVPTLTVTLADVVAATDVEFYYVIMRSAN